METWLHVTHWDWLELNSNGAATRALPVALFRISNLASDIGGGDLRAILRTLYHSLVETVVNFDSCLNDFFSLGSPSSEIPNCKSSWNNLTPLKNTIFQILPDSDNWQRNLKGKIVISCQLNCEKSCQGKLLELKVSLFRWLDLILGNKTWKNQRKFFTCSYSMTTIFKKLFHLGRKQGAILAAKWTW